MKLVHGGDVYRHPDVIDFSANINPLGTPRSVVEAAREAVGQIEHYPDVCCQELKKALADYEGVKRGSRTDFFSGAGRQTPAGTAL